MTIKCLIFDIDGTLADCRHRQHYVLQRPKNFKAFYGEMADDGIVPAVRELTWMATDTGRAVILCSGRPDNYREITEKWLARYDVTFTKLYMRAEGDYRPDHIVKSQILDGILADGYEPILVIDDRPSVVKMWRERGLTCLQANDGFEGK